MSLALVDATTFPHYVELVAGRAERVSTSPLGQRIWTFSALEALPSPKCSRRSLCEMKPSPLRTSLSCLSAALFQRNHSPQRCPI